MGGEWRGGGKMRRRERWRGELERWRGRKRKGEGWRGKGWRIYGVEGVNIFEKHDFSSTLFVLHLWLRGLNTLNP